VSAAQEFVFLCNKRQNDGARERERERESLSAQRKLYSIIHGLLDNICDAGRYHAPVWQVGGLVKNKREKVFAAAFTAPPPHFKKEFPALFPTCHFSQYLICFYRGATAGKNLTTRCNFRITFFAHYFIDERATFQISHPIFTSFCPCLVEHSHDY